MIPANMRDWRIRVISIYFNCIIGQISRISGCFEGTVRIYFEAAGFIRPENESSGVKR